MDRKVTLLMVLSGFGISKETNGNAIKNAKIPTINKLKKQYPNSVLNASGKYVRITRRTNRKFWNR